MQKPFENFKRFLKDIHNYANSQNLENSKSIAKFLSETHLTIKEFPSDQKLTRIHKRIIYTM